MVEKDREAVVMPAMGRRSEKRRTITERVKKRIRRDVRAEGVDRLSLCGDEEEEEWDVDIRDPAPIWTREALMSYTIVCNRTSAGARNTNSWNLNSRLLLINKQRAKKSQNYKNHVSSKASAINHIIRSVAKAQLLPRHDRPRCPAHFTAGLGRPCRRSGQPNFPSRGRGAGENYRADTPTTPNTRAKLRRLSPRPIPFSCPTNNNTYIQSSSIWPPHPPTSAPSIAPSSANSRPAPSSPLPELPSTTASAPPSPTKTHPPPLQLRQRTTQSTTPISPTRPSPICAPSACTLPSSSDTTPVWRCRRTSAFA